MAMFVQNLSKTLLLRYFQGQYSLKIGTKLAFEKGTGHKLLKTQARNDVTSGILATNLLGDLLETLSGGYFWGQTSRKLGLK